jgi:hypothetical protein
MLRPTRRLTATVDDQELKYAFLRNIFTKAVNVPGESQAQKAHALHQCCPTLRSDGHSRRDDARKLNWRHSSVMI